MMKRTAILAFCALALCAADVPAAPARRALLIGINDYSASRFAKPRLPVPDRNLYDLRGTVNDVEIFGQLLVHRYGFQESDIRTLTDHHASRDAILQALDEHLVKPAAKGDVVFFYFGGHGAQVRNSLSDEDDKLDESLVPADSRAGARDIRDKELRRRFNAILDKGAKLTVILDKCNAASGARGLPTGARPRAIEPDLRDVADGTSFGPRPENRGALVLAASQDFDPAWETRDVHGNHHGVFSWALIRSLCESSGDETASEAFLRARARMRAERPYQDPVMAGTPDLRLVPFLDADGTRRRERPVVAVEKIDDEGIVSLQGGWVNGLAEGTELRVVGNGARLKIVGMLGAGRSRARVTAGAVKPGALLEVVGFAPPPGGPLRVWMPQTSLTGRELATLARKLAAAASQRGARWIADPVAATPTHLLRRGASGWELLHAGRTTTSDDPLAAVRKLPRGSSLFVQLPTPSAMIERMAIGPTDGIHPTDRAEDADYILLGRFSDDRLRYAWMRPSVSASDKRRSGLPLRTDWFAEDGGAAKLRRTAIRLRRIHAWHLLQSPPHERSAYRLALRRTRDGAVAEDVVRGNERYEIVLRTLAPSRVRQRYVYVFLIDSHGQSVLLYPQSGSVENRFPASFPAPGEIRLGESSVFAVARPYGVDTYFLLTTDESLPNPWILEWDGVRTRAPESPTALEQFLMLIGSGERAGLEIVPKTWSIEKFVYESVEPRR